MLDAMTLLQEMLQRYSPSTEEGEVARYLAGAMAELGFRAEVDAAGNAVGELGNGPRQIVLLGHIDTVRGVIPVVRRDGCLYGRGAVDAKGPLATFIMAAAALARQPERLEGVTLVVVGAVEEEAATSKGARYAQDKYHPAFAVIGEPSGWSSITLGYKGRLLLTYRLERPMKHTAAEGPSVCEEAADFWHLVREYARVYNREKRAFDTVMPSLRSFNSSSDGFSEVVELLIGFRLPEEITPEAVQQVANGYAGDARLSFSGAEFAVRQGKNNALVRSFLHGIRAQEGTPTFKLKTGTSDMNVLSPVWRCPMVAYGPGDAALDHTPNEHINIGEYQKGIAVLQHTLEHLLENW